MKKLEKMAVAEKELQQAKKDNQALTRYITKRKKRRLERRRRLKRRWRRKPVRRQSSLLDISFIEVF
jgi:hypothetical protein